MHRCAASRGGFNTPLLAAHHASNVGRSMLLRPRTDDQKKCAPGGNLVSRFPSIVVAFSAKTINGR